jgi:photosystem II stability/assembly factor-like uncharacterized protein
VLSLVVDFQDILYSGSSNGIYLSRDHGNSWFPFALRGTSVPVFCISASGAIFAPFSDSTLYRSTNGGKNWVPTSMGAFNLNSLVADPNGDIFAVEGRSGVFRSTDDGGSWINVFSVPIWPPFMGPVVCSPLGILYVLYANALFRSTDHGTTWQGILEAEQGLAGPLGADSKGNVYASGEINGAVYFSADTGSHWKIENSGLSRSTINGFAFNARGRVFASSDSGVLYHDEDSLLWHPVNDGLTILQTTCITVDSAGYVYAGTQGSGVFRSILPTVLSVHERANVIPSTSYLDRNYPNPFNPTTRIQYNLASRGYVEIDVYNILGQFVRDLVQEWKNPGRYFVDFNAAGLASGMYIYRLRFSGETGSFTRTKTMIVLK